MKRSFILLLGLVGALVAQVWKVHLIPAPPGQFYIEQMWNCQIINHETKPVDVTIYAWVTKGGDEICHGRSNPITVPPGGKRITSNDVTEVTDEWHAAGYEQVVSRRNALPAGDYHYCLQVELARGDTILCQDCADHRTVKSSPPRLISPRDSSFIFTPQPTFAWIPPIPPVQGITYRLRIVADPPELTPFEAVSSAEPWFEENDIYTTSFQYPMSGRVLEQDKLYAWRVDAFAEDRQISESKTFCFGIPPFKYPPEAEFLSTKSSKPKPHRLSLISPGENGVIQDSFPWFTWKYPPTPESLVSYTFVLVVADSAPSPGTPPAVRSESSNKPTIPPPPGYRVLSRNPNLTSTTFHWCGCSKPPLKQDMIYLWQVTARKEGVVIDRSPIQWFMVSAKGDTTKPKPKPKPPKPPAGGAL
jgi:hypothetical protein